jgi:hypothetical protein
LIRDALIRAIAQEYDKRKELKRRRVPDDVADINEQYENWNQNKIAQDSVAGAFMLTTSDAGNVYNTRSGNTGTSYTASTILKK